MRGNLRAAAANGFINATDCADYLVAKGMPFRDAYKIVGNLVAFCIDKSLTLETLSINDYKAVSALFENDIYTAISLDTCVKKRTVIGGPAPECTRTEIAKIRALL